MRTLAIVFLAFACGGVLSEAAVIGLESITTSRIKLLVYGIMILIGMIIKIIDDHRQFNKLIKDLKGALYENRSL